MKQKYLIIDLFGVLFLLNKKSILKQLGLWNLFKFYAHYRTNPLEHCFTLLDRMRVNQENEFQEMVAYKNVYLPESLCLWQKGLLDNQQALERVHRYLDTVPEKLCYDRAIIKRVVGILFSAQALIPALELNSALYQQLIAYTNKYSFILFSNIDLETWAHIKTKYPHVIQLFDGTITSGETHILKPDTQIFNYLLTKYNLTPSDCLLIDDQQENCTTAQKLGLDYLHYTQQKELSL